MVLTMRERERGREREIDKKRGIEREREWRDMSLRMKLIRKR